MKCNDVFMRVSCFHFPACIMYTVVWYVGGMGQASIAYPLVYEDNGVSGGTGVKIDLLVHIIY